MAKAAFIIFQHTLRLHYKVICRSLTCRATHRKRSSRAKIQVACFSASLKSIFSPIVNKLWVRSERKALERHFAGSHVDPVISQLLQHMFPSFFNNLTFFHCGRREKDTHWLYIVPRYHKWYNICRHSLAFLLFELRRACTLSTSFFYQAT